MIVDKVEGSGQYKIAIGPNDKIPATLYPYYYQPVSKKENILNFFEMSLNNLQIRFHILRHDKNWLSLSYNYMDMESYWTNDFFKSSNPIVDFNKTYNVKIQAGRNYRVSAGLGNKIAEYNYQDNEFIFKYFCNYSVPIKSKIVLFFLDFKSYAHCLYTG